MATKYMVQFYDSTIEATATDKASVVQDWVHQIRSYHGRQIIAGLDCEWKPPIVQSMSNRSATLQLCVDAKCLILQMFYIDYIPQSLKSFLSDPNVTFVEVEVGDDVLKLRDEYGLHCTRTSDIQALAMASWPWMFFGKPGLKYLANEVVGLYIQKPIHICQSNWEARVLDAEQVEYACIDAYASYRIRHKLFTRIIIVIVSSSEPVSVIKSLNSGFLFSVNWRDFLVDLESGVISCEEETHNDPVSNNRPANNLSTKLFSGVLGFNGSNMGECGVSSHSDLGKANGIPYENIDLIIDKSSRGG
ncbi:unnamed protein product [Ilex paraguariensis]|uniref:3'-5' exonuclease domain-containing protein n=1 Tax=Ilex paraguariensis TaxID=185542 RepID=A0ABC8S6S2_9AQUA